MERYNPFAANISAVDDTDPFTTSFNRSSNAKPSTLGRQVATRTDSAGSARSATGATASSRDAADSSTARYTTSFPDPFAGYEGQLEPASSSGPAPPSANRSNSVTFAPSSHSIDDSTSSSGRQARAGPPGSGISSFLSRATSVTSSTVTDRVSGAMGSMRSAVDSISSQIQQAVPTNLNERLSSTASNLMGSSEQVQLQQQPQSAASYLASKISSATGQFTSSGQGAGSMPVISRQRVLLILDEPTGVDWAQQFSSYRKLTSGGSSGPQSASQSATASFFSSATAQLTASASGSSSTSCDGTELVEQADFRDITVLANQNSSTVTIFVSNNSAGSNKQKPNAPGGRSVKIIRPEYVVVKQRTRDRLDHMRGIVGALNYCLVPTFEPIEVWNVFQDRQMVFAKLLRVQKTLGKENFPLIPQIYCQTHQDLLNCISSSALTLPCLVRTGPMGKGKIRIDNLSMFRDFASIMATGKQSCTVEQYLEVKCDLIVQKLGTSMKLFRKNMAQTESAEAGQEQLQQQQQFQRQAASRQPSLGSSILSSLIPMSSSQQQAARRSSNPNALAYEKLNEVSVRYRNWVEAIAREFDNKLEAFCIKIAVASNDREYIVGLKDCSMDFLGSLENQEEDKRSFVELILSNMDTVLPKHTVSRQSSSNLSAAPRKISSSEVALDSPTRNNLKQQDSLPLADKKKFTSQTQINGINHHPTMDGSGLGGGGNAANRTYGHLSSRSQSVSVNQSDYLANEPVGINRSSYFTRRGSDRSDSLTTEDNEDLVNQDDSIYSSSTTSGLHQRQSSLGQSLFDQTSTALSSFQRQSLSFFKRLDSRTGEVMTNTPPMSAKSDKGFDRNFAANKVAAEPEMVQSSSKVSAGAGYKSQSVDSSTLERTLSDKPRKRVTPPKPPPPQMLANRQSSLVTYSTTNKPATSSTTPNSSPVQTRQSLDGADEAIKPTRVVRQNSALSAFAPFDPDIITERQAESMRRRSSQNLTLDSNQNLASATDRVQNVVGKNVNFDSASINSGNSNSTGETTTAEDTMNNLKKTFASIFGDKCE